MNNFTEGNNHSFNSKNNLGNSNDNKPKIDVDIVFCVDTSSDMHVFKNEIYHCMMNVCHRISESDTVNDFRVRLIAFKDFIADGEEALRQTPFVTASNELGIIEDCWNNLVWGCGGDYEDDGLEALSLAIKSAWNTSTRIKRQIIVVWAGSACHPLGFGNKSKFYPENMPKNIHELRDLWNNWDSPGKRLLLFAPNEYGWNEVSSTFDDVCHLPFTECDNHLLARDFEMQISSMLGRNILNATRLKGDLAKK